MLDNETKRRIDTCRDILVGKLPDPKSQVEQITIALIYKFMDDMDKEALEFGGDATFFTGDYERYGWSKIFDPKLSGFDMLNLYSEAIQKMNQNPGIPKLFREIFKNAFLPYRDPETLKLFLKTIYEFQYDHSERLGDAFEYLLSVLGSQGDAGQFRTPRHIIDFIVAVIQPKKNDTICDPACGTAGFLISSYKYILNANTNKTKGDLLTPDERKNLVNNFVGYDISPDMVRLSLVNLYLHNFPAPHIYEYDTLTSEERWNEYFDVIMANPPFMSPKGGIKPHKKFTMQANRSEVLFVDYIAEHINPTTGRAGIIVPEGIIFQSATAYKSLRRMLIENGYLYAVVSLPAGVFNPYSGVKTSILLMDKTLAAKTDKILFVRISNDGFGLGAQRKELQTSDLPDAANLILDFQAAVRSGDYSKFESEELPLQPIIVEKSKIAANGDYNLSADRYRVNELRHHKFEMVEIGELCNLINGRAFKPEDWEAEENGGLPIIRIQNLNNADAEFNYFSGYVDDKHIVNNGDLLFSWSGSRGTSFGAHIWSGKKAVLNQHIFKVEHDNRALREYLHLALNSAVAEVEENLHGGVGLVHITKGNLQIIRIPLPPLSIQKEIVEKIEGFQRIIGGAKQIIASYKPQIEVEPEWEMVELGEVIESKPKNGYSGSPVDRSTNLKVLSLSATTSGKIDLTKFKFLDEDIPLDSSCRCRRGDIYLQRGNTRELVGTAAIFDVDDENYIYPDLMIRVRANEAKIQSYYLLTVLQSAPVREFIGRNAVGAAGNMPKINQTIVESIPIPLPPLPVQQEIVARITREQELVNSNHELIRLFEAKIKATIDKIWEA